VIRACTMARAREIESAERNWLAQFHTRRPAPRRYRAVPCRVAPHRTTPRRAAPCRAASHRAAPRRAESSRAATTAAPRHGSAAPFLCHVVVYHAFDNRHLRPCVRTPRLFSRMISRIISGDAYFHFIQTIVTNVLSFFQFTESGLLTIMHELGS